MNKYLILALLLSGCATHGTETQKPDPKQATLNLENCANARRIHVF